MPVTAVECHHQRHRRPPVPSLGDVGGEAAPRVALVGGVENPPARAILAEGGVAQARDHRAVVPERRLEEPSAHRIEGGRERIEGLLHRGEGAQRPVQAQGLPGARGLDEDRDEVDRASRHVGEAIAHETQLGRPSDLFQRALGAGHGVSPGGQLPGQAPGPGRVQVPLRPRHLVERAEERRQEPRDRLDRGRGRGHGGHDMRPSPMLKMDHQRLESQIVLLSPSPL